MSRFTHIRSTGAGKSSWKDFWEFEIEEKKYRVEVEFKAFLAYEIILYLGGERVSSSKPINNSLLKGNTFQDEKLTFKINNHECIFICKSSIELEYDLFVDGFSVGNGERIINKEMEMDKMKKQFIFLWKIAIICVVIALLSLLYLTLTVILNSGEKPIPLILIILIFTFVSCPMIPLFIWFYRKHQHKLGEKR